MNKYIKDWSGFTSINESIETDPEFVDYIVSVEGVGPGSSPETGHKAYKDVVGVWTIGYGHAETSDILPKPKPGMKITDAKAKEILKKDIADAEKKVRNYISNKFPGKTLDQNQLKMLTDYAFNPGLSKFPTFVKAVVNKDWQTASQEYKRYAGKLELTDRNKKFYDLFLAPLLNGSTTAKEEPAKKQTAAAVGGTEFVPIGKTLYPVKSSKADFANVRNEPIVNGGVVTNIIATIKWPNPVGVAKYSKQDDKKMTWYYIELPKGTSNNYTHGWVRFDAVTIDKNAKYI